MLKCSSSGIHSICFILVLRSAALRPNIDLELERDQQGVRTGMGTAVQMLMQKADSFFLRDEMVAERAEVENYQMTAGISNLGLQLQDRFRMFAVMRAFDLAGRSAEGSFSPTSQIQIFNTTSPGKSRAKRRRAKAIIQASERIRTGKGMGAEGCEEDRNLDRWLRAMKSTYGTRRAFGTAQHLRARATLKNYCRILKIVKEKGRHIEIDMEDVKRLQEAATSPTARRTEEPLEPVQRGSIRQSEGEKRNWHRVEALRSLDWISNWNASDIQLLKELYVRAVIMNKNLNNLVRFISETAEIDWLTAEPEAEKPRGVKGKLLKGAKFVSKFTKDYIKKLGKSSILFFSNCWSSFKRHLRNSERRCELENEESSMRAAKKAGLPRSTSTAAISQRAQRLSSMEIGVLKKEGSKVDKAMDLAIDDANQGSLTEAEAKAKIGTARETAQQLHQQLDAGKLDSIDEAEDLINEVESTVCKTQRKSSFQRLKDMLRRTKDIMVAGSKVSAPNLGIRGVGMSAGVLGGGLEEVVDFRNREIAQFRWGSGFFGASVGGMGMGGYAGVGWKGYKENWTLQEAHVTGLWSSHSLATSIFGLYAGLSVTFGLDADNSVAGPWVPEPHGEKSVTLGWSAGASITKAVMPIGRDVGASYCWYLNSECFDSLSEFIKYLWLPICKDCEGSEQASISALRFGIHAPSFPIISEMAFSLIAALYERNIREPEYKSECSPGSVTTRKSPDSTNFLRQIGDLMFRNARLLEDLVGKWDMLLHDMSMAETYNENMKKSKEYRRWLQAAMKDFHTCPRQGPIVGMTEDTMNVYREMTDEDLLGLCRTYRIHYGLELFCDASETRRSREDRLLRYDSLKEGWLSAEELRKLMLEVRSTSDAGQIFLERRQTCLDSGQNSSVYQCMPSLEALKIFDSKVPGKEVFRICERKGLACTRTKTQSKACRVCGTRVRSKLRGFCRNCDKTEIDKQSMAMKILHVFGGGLTESTGRDSGFGSCEKAEDCWMPQTECAGEEGSKYCLCKVGTCFSMVRNVSNFGDDTDLFPVCQAKPNSWREIAADLKRSFLTYRYSLGQMAGRIKSLPRQ